MALMRGSFESYGLRSDVSFWSGVLLSLLERSSWEGVIADNFVFFITHLCEVCVVVIGFDLALSGSFTVVNRCLDHRLDHAHSCDNALD